MFIVTRKVPGIDVALNQAKGKERAVRREMFLKELSSLRMLLRQGMAIRGHLRQQGMAIRGHLRQQGMAIRGHDETDGNFRQLLLLRSEDDSRLKQWIEDNRYLSVDIVNECIVLMGQHILRDILSDVHKAQDSFQYLLMRRGIQIIRNS